MKHKRIALLLSFIIIFYPVLVQAYAVNSTAAKIDVVSIGLDKTWANLSVGGTIKLEATVYPLNASNKNVTWKSSNTNVAIVDSIGKITAIGAGTALITATTEEGNKAEICAITVVAKLGWKKENNNWYYYDLATGYMLTGWLADNNTWYYLKSDGSTSTGWIADEQNWYYLNSCGVMATGWIKDGKSWYYLKPNGAMATGWIIVDDNWYYLYSDGSMAYNTTIDGYRINENGAWINK